jgi:type III pantothenate kinase
MTALFESGSSRLHFAWWDGEKPDGFVTMTYPRDGMFTDETISCLIGEAEPDRIAACSVSSKWREKLFEALHCRYPGKLVTARTASDIGLVTPYKQPETYGIDRALAVKGAFGIFGNSCVTVDIGTAVTVDAVDENGAVLGGYIFPGTDMMSEVLAERTDLPFVRAEFENTNPGTDTYSALKYSLGKGFIAALDALLLSACEMAGTTERIIVTGGGAEHISGLFSMPVMYEPHLVLQTLGSVSENLPLYT